MRTFLLVALLAACGGAKNAGPPQPDECAAAAENVVSLSGAGGDVEALAAAEEECKASWTREELACVRRATTSADVGVCFRAAE